MLIPSTKLPSILPVKSWKEHASERSRYSELIHVPPLQDNASMNRAVPVIRKRNIRLAKNIRNRSCKPILLGFPLRHLQPCFIVKYKASIPSNPMIHRTRLILSTNRTTTINTATMQPMTTCKMRLLFLSIFLAFIISIIL